MCKDRHFKAKMQIQPPAELDGVEVKLQRSDIRAACAKIFCGNVHVPYSLDLDDA